MCSGEVRLTEARCQDSSKAVGVDVLNLAEILLVIAGLSTNVYLIAQKDGAVIRRILPLKLLMLCGFFFLFESLSMLCGFQLTRIAFFRDSSSADLKKFCYFCTAVLFLIIAAYMLYKAFTEQDIDEHVGEIRVVTTIFQAFGLAVFAFISGIGWGFIGHNIVQATGVLACATVIAVIAGVYAGFREGCRYRRTSFAAGGAMLLFVGVEILIRYL